MIKIYFTILFFIFLFSCKRNPIEEYKQNMNELIPIVVDPTEEILGPELYENNGSLPKKTKNSKK